MRRIWILGLLLTTCMVFTGSASDKDLGLHSDGGLWQFYEDKSAKGDLPKVLLIGDSIMNGYRGRVIATLKGKANVDCWLTPLHLASKDLHHDLRRVLAQGPYDVVHFNIGLHGWAHGRILQSQYAPLLQEYVDILSAHSPLVRIVWASTTQITVKGKPTQLDPVHNKTIVERNIIAAKLMAEQGIPVNDLYGLLIDRLNLARGDKYHWKGQGYVLMAKQIVVAIQSALADRPLVVFVAPNGADANPGTKDKPLKTLEAARDMVRGRKAEVRGRRSEVGGRKAEDQRAVVLLAPGTYRRTKTFELDERDSDTVYRTDLSDQTDQSNVACISGGVDIPFSAVKPVTDVTILNRIVEVDARSHLLQINLKELGIADYGEFGPRGFRRYYIPAPLELFVDDKAQNIARWPNPGEHHIPLGNVIDAGSRPRKGDYSFRVGTFEYRVKRPEQWTKAADMYVSGIFCYGWADDTIQVSKIDTAAGTFTTTHPHIYGFVKRSYCSWYALNLLEEIDIPGEYYVDNNSGILYFYPPENFDKKSKISVSLLEDVMVAVEGASNVRFEGLMFEVTRGSGIYIERGSNNVIAGCMLRNMGIVAIQIGKGIKPFPYGKHDACGNKEDGKPGEPISRQLGSWHEHIYKYSAWDREAGTSHRIISCDIYDIGAGGISLGGGDRKTLTPGNNSVINCDIYRVNRWDRTYKAPVNVDGVGNSVVNCHLHDCQGGGIYLHGNDHRIEYNEFDHLLTDMSDMGSIYMGRDPSESGNRFNYNFFHNIKNFHKGGAGVQAIFFDDCSCTGAEMIGNVFYKAGSNSSIKFNGGGVCDIVNNIFVDCPKPVGGGGNNTKRVRTWMAGALGQERLRKRVDVTVPPYSTSYPELLALYKHEIPIVTTPKRNYVVKGDHSQFENAEEFDFRLKKDSTVYKDIAGFKSVPFEKMGLYKDSWRLDVAPRYTPPPPIDLSNMKPVRNVRINFQPAGAALEGWSIDTGNAFAVGSDGAAYGWSRDNTQAARRRGKHKDKLLDSLVHFTGSMSWKIAVAPGIYSLKIMIGDSEHPSEDQTIFANGQTLCSSIDLTSGEFRIFTMEVTAKDGFIVLASKNAPHGPKLTRMNWLDINKL